MAPAQGWHANSWSVPNFFQCEVLPHPSSQRNPSHRQEGDAYLNSSDYNHVRYLHLYLHQGRGVLNVLSSERYFNICTLLSILVCLKGSLVRTSPPPLQIFRFSFNRFLRSRRPMQWFWTVSSVWKQLLLVFENPRSPSRWIFRRSRAVGRLKFWEEMRAIHSSSGFLETQWSNSWGVMTDFVRTRIQWITPRRSKVG